MTKFFAALALAATFATPAFAGQTVVIKNFGFDLSVLQIFSGASPAKNQQDLVAKPDTCRTSEDLDVLQAAGCDEDAMDAEPLPTAAEEQMDVAQTARLPRPRPERPEDATASAVDPDDAAQLMLRAMPPIQTRIVPFSQVASGLY